MTIYEIVQKWHSDCQLEKGEDHTISEEVLLMLARKYQKFLAPKTSEIDNARFTYYGMMIIAKLAFDEGANTVDFNSKDGFYNHVTFEEWWALLTSPCKQ